MTTTDSSFHDQIMSEMQHLISRADTKAGYLLALLGALGAVIASTAPGLHPSPPAVATGILAAVGLAAASVLLLLVVRPRTGGHLTLARLAAANATEAAKASRADELVRLADRKHRLTRWAVDTLFASIGLLATAAALA
ncbi:hypothetical protein [Streptomyces sp. NRRL S-1868]|uniref:hypothetical protein n=1 Tax=Streptomyces sp. NRRL S-1868 TaxID=1463892 RepID=UPI0005630BB5|nr:hypothetical protein [Streptomyces sp. NRRL S-1868]